ncbi:MAG: T9SS type A sorting domain-containing protein [Ignavibacteriota bacterium]|nr:T9SS C-terminal target domain-containing protein [Ignavibacteriota bacterium]QKJ97818.1 MAG: T9SS type A sorting domain-containing protein [Ignavibacteriota bacterium]
MTTFSDTAVIINNIYTYQINNGPFPNGFSNEATAYVQNIVPVELQSFTAEIIGSDVNLLWSTATETNNSGFDVEKKALSFGEGLGEAWKTIGFVHGFGTTTEVHHYLFVDERLQAGNYQYRLKQIDFDGTFEYSNIIEVTIDAPIEFSLEQNFPNPFNPTTKIKYTIPASLNPSKGGTLVQLQVFDILGNAVATLVNEQKQPGTYEVEFNTASHSGEVRNLPAGRQGLPSGIYFYKLQAGTFVQTKKMILIK